MFHAFLSRFSKPPGRRRLPVLTLVAGLLVGAVLAPIVASAGLDSGGSVYVARATQCVLFDTRESQGGQGALSGGETRFFVLFGSPLQGGEEGCAVDLEATGYQVNLVAINPTGAGNLKAWSAQEEEPNGGIVNYQALDPGVNNANSFLTPTEFNEYLGVMQPLAVKANGAAVHVRGVLMGEMFNGDDRYALKADVQALQAATFPGRVNFGPVDFIAASFNNDNYVQNALNIYPDPDQFVAFYAPVHLPQGATITRVVAVGVDNNGASEGYFRFDLHRLEITATSLGDIDGNSDLLARAGSTASDLNAIREVEDTTINDPVVDNTKYVYTLDVDMRRLGPNVVAFLGAYIEYIL